MNKLMNKVLHLNTQLKAKEDEDGRVKISGYASTTDIDRAGDIINSDAWQKGGLDNFKKNPIILFNHNYDRPIGRATAVSVTDKGLSIEATISKAASDIVELIKDGVLNAFSVGFMVKDAEYDSSRDIFIIKDAELYETSVVSVPCNQDATFSVAKMFNTKEEYKEFIQNFDESAGQSAEETANAQDSADPEVEKDLNTKETEMDKQELEAMLKQVAEETAKSITLANKEQERLDAEAKANKEKEEESFNIRVKSSAEKLMTDIEDRFKNKNEELETIVNELKDELKSKASEIESIRESKRVFSDRSSGNWKSQFGEEITDKYILGLATGSGWDTKSAKQLLEKVNTEAGVEVSSADFEQIVSTNIERDIQNELVLAPMFRELPMNSATMILPIMPDSGYAEFGAPSTYSTRNATQTAPKGNLDSRSATFGDHTGVDLTERTVSTQKLISTSFLGNETEEDAILPILPLIREAMVRSHARSIEQALLLGNNSQGVYTSGAFDGLCQLAEADGHTWEEAATGYAASDVITAAQLFGLRKSMGKYGLRPEDVVYIVSQDVYYDLIDDAEFQDANLVGEGTATKLKGKIGSVYGSNVVVCDEFPTKAADAYCAVAVYTRNYLIPRLRGIKVETDYQVQEQRKVLVASQRLGFVDLIDGAKSKYAATYKGT